MKQILLVLALAGALLLGIVLAGPRHEPPPANPGGSPKQTDPTAVPDRALQRREYEVAQRAVSVPLSAPAAPPAPEPAPTTAEFEGDADALSREYESNEIAADRKLKSHTIKLTGSVKTVGRTAWDDAYVSFHSESWSWVQAFFPKAREDSLSALRPGQRVTMICRVHGKSLGHVAVNDCYLVKGRPRRSE